MKYSCYVCEVSTNEKDEFQKHLDSKEHKDAFDASVKNVTKTKCGICCKTFSSKYKRDVHQKKCNGTITHLQCQFCFLLYFSSSNKCRHEKTCQSKMKKENEHTKSSSTENQNQNCVTGENNTNCNNTTFNNTTNNTNCNNTNCNNTTNNNININIQLPKNAFGLENLNYLSEEQYANFMRDIIKYNFDGIINFFKEVFFNEEHMENQTIRCLEKNSPFIQCFTGKYWKNSPTNITITKILDNIGNKLRKYLADAENPKVKPIQVRDFIDAIGLLVLWNDLYLGNVDMNFDINEIYDRKIDEDDPSKIILNTEEKKERQKFLNLFKKYIHKKSVEISSTSHTE